MTFQWRTFQGVRLALFHRNTAGQPGGQADLDDCVVEEPRASGIERALPSGRTITLTSGADGSFLAADTPTMPLVYLPVDAAGAATPNARFQVLDLGQGRVARRALNGRVVSTVGAPA